MNDFISVTNYRTSRDLVAFRTKDEFFKGEIVVIDEIDRIVFRKPCLDDVKTRKFCLNNGWLSMNYFESYIRPGRYYFDEDDSNEDQRVIYYKIN